MENNKTTVKERLIIYIKSKKISVRAFERLCGLSNGYVNNISKDIGGEVLQKILSKFPTLNQDWLYGGEEPIDFTEDKQVVEGDVNNSTGVNVHGENININDHKELFKIVTKFQEQIDRMLSIIEEKDKTINYLISNSKLG